MDNQQVLVVFHGPHALISSTWYEEDHVVPTWNYVAVHVYGTVKIVIDPEELRQLMLETLLVYEPDLDISERLDDAFYVKLMEAVVGLKIVFSKMEGKWKLSQNHTLDRQR